MENREAREKHYKKYLKSLEKAKQEYETNQNKKEIVKYLESASKHIHRCAELSKRIRKRGK